MDQETARTVRIDYRSFCVAGVSYRPGEIIDALGDEDELRLVAEPENPHDMFAIRVEARFVWEQPNEDNPRESWELIGYVPRKETAHYHILRKLGAKVYLKLFVNSDAPDTEKLLVKTLIDADPQAQFICEKAS